MMIGHVDAFQIGADDWEQYTERLEQYLVANGINDAGKKLAVFVTVIGSKAYSLLSDLLSVSSSEVWQAIPYPFLG